MILSRSFFLAISLLLSACVVSDTPLSSPRDADRDLRLEGLWRCDLVPYFYIAYGPDAHGSILCFGRDKTGMGVMRWDFFVTRTPKHRYLNLDLREVIERGHIKRATGKGYIFADCRFPGAASLFSGWSATTAFRGPSRKGNFTVKPTYSPRPFRTRLRSVFLISLRHPDPKISSRNRAPQQGSAAPEQVI